MLLNNDVELITPDIFQSMLGFCMRPEVGIVGAKLLYNDHTVQHAGVLVGAGGLADHVFKGIHEDDPGTWEELFLHRMCQQLQQHVFL